MKEEGRKHNRKGRRKLSRHKDPGEGVTLNITKQKPIRNGYTIAWVQLYRKALIIVKEISGCQRAGKRKSDFRGVKILLYHNDGYT